MNAKQAEFLKNALEYNGREVEVYPDYSGHGMNGETTIGLVGDFGQKGLSEEIVAYMKTLSPEDLEAVPDLDPLRWDDMDDMGRGKIVY